MITGQKNGSKPPDSSASFPISPLGMGEKGQLSGEGLETILSAHEGVNNPNPPAETLSQPDGGGSDPMSHRSQPAPAVPGSLVLCRLTHAGASLCCQQGLI